METFKAMCKACVELGASDIHAKADNPIVLRISRELRAIDIGAGWPTNPWFESVFEQIVPNHLKEGLRKDRETDFSYFEPGIGRFRTNIFQQSGKWALAMRYVKSQVPTFRNLGLHPMCEELSKTPRGIILLAGTTGSGKSTTLAAMIEYMNENMKRHIVTLEDPIEYMFEDNQCVIEQREVGLDTQSFARGLKSALRQDPDVIMVGEMRDAISVAAAISAADTGHLVLSTIHTTNSATSVGRILDFFIPEERDTMRRQLSTTLRAVITQRMVPSLDGRMTPAQEIMINTPMVRKLIEENRLDKLPAAIETGQEDGMQSFNQSLYDLTQQGRISKEQALDKATNPQQLEMLFQGIKLSSTGSRILG
jgi:twitching motility protein PilT